MKPRSLLVVTFLLGMGVLIHTLPERPLQAQQPPKVPPGGPDRFGDLLPSAQALQRLGTVRFRHGNRILALAYSPDGKTLVAGGSDDTTRLWDADTGKEIRQLRDDARQIRDVWAFALAFSPNGKVIASGNGFKTIRLWDANTGKELHVLKGHQGAVKAVAFSPDGTLLASGSQDRTVRLWDVATGRELAVYQGHTEEVNAVAFARDGKTVASGSSDRTIRLWNGKPARTLSAGCVVYALAYAPEGGLLASAGDDNLVRLWDPNGGKQTGQLKGHKDTVVSLAFADGQTLYSGSLDGTARRWDVAKRAETLSIPRRLGDCSVMALARDGAVLASAGKNNIIRRFDAKTGKELPVIDGHVAPITAAVCSPDGNQAASVSADGEIRLWDARTGKELLRWASEQQGEIRLAFAPDGKTLASGGGPGGVRIWDVSSGKQSQHLPSPNDDLVLALAYAPGGKTLAVGYRQGGVRVWDVAAAKVTQPLNYPGGAEVVACSPDGKLLVAAGSGPILIWDTATWDEPRKLGKSSPVAALAFSPDSSKLAAGMWDASIQLHDLGKNPKEPRLFEGHQSGITALAFAPSGRFLASASHDRTVKLWEVVNGQPIWSWAGHQGPARAVAIAAGVRTVVSAGTDTTLLIWDVTGSLRDGKLPAVDLQVQALEGLWSDLASDDNPRGNRALWTMVAGAKQSVPHLKKKVFLVDPAKIKRYIEDLNDNKFVVREKASAALASYGRWIEGVLQEAARNPVSYEVRLRLDKLLGMLKGKEAVSLDQERLRARRVIEILEQAQTPEARELLESLARGAAEPDLRWTAGEAVRRLKKPAPMGGQ